MNRRLYTRLAWAGIRKNSQLYLPFILTCVCVVMMYYILASLVWSELLIGTYGGRTMTMILALGRVVIAIFAVIFLFYTHSFLIRRRNREFGLYNILGMNKRDIRRILLRESLIIYALTLACGTILGFLFSKLSELLLLRITGNSVTYSLSFSMRAFGEAAALFAGIFLLILLVSVARVQLSGPLSLLKSEAVGEKPPKANYVLAILGALLLAAAYFIALSIEDPVEALTAFFFAVIMVICATYLLFVSGSVALCRVLQKNKGYYYKANHFVSTASMTYRMKRNGAGLASICILSTMVLVMLATTTTLFAGIEDNLRKMYPSDVRGSIEIFDVEDYKDEYFEACKAKLHEATGGVGVNESALRSVETYGVLGDDGTFFPQGDPEMPAVSQTAMTELVLIPLEDYNALTGQALSLSPDEALLWTARNGAATPENRLPARFAFHGFDSLRVVGSFDYPALRIPVTPEGTTCALVLADPVGYAKPVTDEEIELNYCFNFMYDIDRDAAKAAEEVPGRFDFIYELRTCIPESVDLGYTSGAFDEQRESTYALYGSLFFLGIILSIVFILAAVLIIYYKQVSEGYEDAARFGVMRKVGMTQREIRRSVNSQVLTVFFAPLALAGLHIAFAFPMIRRMLLIFGVTDLGLLIPVYAGAFVLFALFYALVYHRTAKTYMTIVQ
ncbi:MAG: ABC transporter permease [Oscillospiraceae bacterium]|nr:ABC transporter permease [Oscillospiraceae bacterium]